MENNKKNILLLLSFPRPRKTLVSFDFNFWTLIDTYNVGVHPLQLKMFHKQTKLSSIFK